MAEWLPEHDEATRLRNTGWWGVPSHVIRAHSLAVPDDQLPGGEASPSGMS
ncbi:hypothetical protein HUT19_40915 [Streptomyces sp. NA02950]|uniref:hypothetical protein n=1 Tax=Streptomyces sp. NA02950 TaxID=2742137 RepID=UPI0015912C5E|nr:hypothetical protein [Streptomyces sp. NA02950]QKV90419.1 hypothetical protein HUT19_00305 [Streptomyces sp. NA02950]QKV97248.1 hypothetical protein HUT19_40915 [Streptomyces sp. NA02950]